MKIDEMKNETAEVPTEFNQYSVSSAPHGPSAEKKTNIRKLVAWGCAFCIVLSAACGFGGAYVAAKLAAPAAVTETSDAQQSSAGSADGLYQKTGVMNASSRNLTASGEDMTYANVAALVKDSVVEINTEYTTHNSWFQFTTGGAGSGVILSEDGYIITNAHVILDNNQQNPADTVTVRLTDGTEYTAEVKAYDKDEDIAVLKIDADKLSAAHIGDSDSLVVGEELLIVGNPLGELGGTVTNGIVSATEREIQVEGVTMHLIQTNAAVNPGNSGGGMFNMKGELVGIVNAKSSGTGIEGLGFAIPINQAAAVSEELLTKGYVSGKPMIGVSFSDVSNGTGTGLFSFGGFGDSTAKAGVYVRSLVEGMNDKALKVGDRVIAVNGEEISSTADVKAIVSAAAIGDKLTFQVSRDNKLIEVKVTVYERTPDIEAAASAAEENKTEDQDDSAPAKAKPAIGVSLREVPGEDGTMYFGGSTKEGVYIAGLEEGMNDEVLKVGDRIVAINGEEIETIADVKAIVEKSEVGDKLKFQVARDGKLTAVTVTVFERTAEEDAGYAAPEEQEEAPEEESDGFSGFGDLAEFFRRFFGGR